MTATDWVGRVIDGRYVVEALIGRGGMGVVLAARHKFTGTRVALKMVRSDLGIDAEVEARFLAEARVPATIGHRSVVNTLDAGKTPEGELYLVMELLTGRSLRHEIMRGVGAPSVRRIGMELLDVLAAAHARGIVHRDVKPENIFLVEPTASVKLLDFGITKVLAGPTSVLPKTATGIWLGTLEYMSPEQLADARGVDARADLWATGVILYEMLAGRRPHRATTVEEMFAALVKGRPDPIRMAMPSATPDIEAFFERALARDAMQRFASAAEMAVALARLPLAASTPVVARPAGGTVTMATGLAATAATPGSGMPGLPASVAGTPGAHVPGLQVPGARVAPDPRVPGAPVPSGPHVPGAPGDPGPHVHGAPGASGPYVHGAPVAQGPHVHGAPVPSGPHVPGAPAAPAVPGGHAHSAGPATGGGTHASNAAVSPSRAPAAVLTPYAAMPALAGQVPQAPPPGAVQGHWPPYTAAAATTGTIATVTRTVEAPSLRSRRRFGLALGAIATVALGAVVVVAVSRGGDTPPPPGQHVITRPSVASGGAPSSPSSPSSSSSPLPARTTARSQPAPSPASAPQQAPGAASGSPAPSARASSATSPPSPASAAAPASPSARPAPSSSSSPSAAPSASSAAPLASPAPPSASAPAAPLSSSRGRAEGPPARNRPTEVAADPARSPRGVPASRSEPAGPASPPGTVPPQQDTCATGCAFLARCHLGSSACETDCARNPTLHACLQHAGNDCNRFAACWFASSCRGITPNGSHSCSEAIDCEARCGSDSACVCSCIAGLTASHAAALLAYNGCAIQCRDTDCVARRCSNQVRRCRAQ